MRHDAAVNAEKRIRIHGIYTDFHAALKGDFMSEYVVPPAVLNAAIFGYDRMPHCDEFYQVPEHWLEVNASRFLFTDEQIISAASPQFPGYAHSIERWGDYPQVCGIYFLVADKEIIYVGQSNCIPRRIFQHRDNLVDFDSLAWFEAPEIFLSSIEGYYIARIQPRLNRCNPQTSAFARRQMIYAFPPSVMPIK